MDGFLLHVGMVATCPHGGNVQTSLGSTRVRIDHKPALRVTDLCLICGCSFMVFNKAQPCLTVRWNESASRVRIEHLPAVLEKSARHCLSAEQIPQEPLTVSFKQNRVRGK